MISKEFNIMEPVWSCRGVGLNFKGLNDVDLVAVKVEYVKKNGALAFPHVHIDSVFNLKKAIVKKMKKKGVELWVVPLDRFTSIVTREDYEAKYKVSL